MKTCISKLFGPYNAVINNIVYGLLDCKIMCKLFLCKLLNSMYVVKLMIRNLVNGFCFETRSHCVIMAGLELTIWTRLALNSLRSACFLVLGLQVYATTSSCDFSFLMLMFLNFKSFTLCVQMFDLHVFMCHVCAWCPKWLEKGIRFPGTGVMDGSEPYGCW